MLQGILGQRKTCNGRFFSSLIVLLICYLASTGAESGPRFSDTGQFHVARQYFEVKSDSPLTVSLYIDRKENKAFVAADEDFKGFIYGFGKSTAANIEIRLDNSDIMGLWKGNATIKEGSRWLFEDAVQFAPVFLVVDVKNTGAKQVQVTGAYLEVEDSFTDFQPYLVMEDTWSDCGEMQKFDPSFEFINFGWGAPEDASITYSFGNQTRRESATFNSNVRPDGDHAIIGSVLQGLQMSEVRIDRLKTEKFHCPSHDQIRECAQKLVKSGLVGQISDAVFTNDYGYLLTNVFGTINYNWTDSHGIAHSRSQPISVEIPLLQFPGNGAECGAPGPVERNYKTAKLSLDKKNYRIPLPYSGNFALQQQRRFALNLVADKSSQHFFKVVLQLADGTTTASPSIDLLYFMPRFEEAN
jgi:hypothetical protein